MDGKDHSSIDEDFEKKIDEEAERAYECISDEQLCEGLDDWERFLTMLGRGTPFERYMFKKWYKQAYVEEFELRYRQKIREILEEHMKSDPRLMVLRFIECCYPEALEAAQGYVAKIDDSTILHELWLKISTTEEQKEIRQFFHHELTDV